MNMRNYIFRGGGLLAALLALGASPGAFAATTAGNTVSQTVTLNFEVGGIAQTQQTANDSFVVDRLVNLSVVGGSDVSVISGGAAANRYRSFTITNTTNAAMDFILSTSDGTDQFDIAVVDILVDTVGDSTVDGDEATQNYVDNLAAGGSIIVWVRTTAAVPTGTNGDADIVNLRAQAADPSGSVGTPGAAITADTVGETAGTVDNVVNDGAGTFAGDAARDGAHSDDARYVLQAAALTLTKTSVVISDPVNGTTNPKRIPGAVVEYRISVSNAAGASTADNIAIEDTLDTETVFEATVPRRSTSGTTCEDGGDTSFTNADDNDGGDKVDADTIEFTYANLAASSSVLFCYRVTIN